MTIMDRDEAKRLMEKVLGYSKAEECEVNINGSVTGNVRYALNTVTTSTSALGTTQVIDPQRALQAGIGGGIKGGANKTEELLLEPPPSFDGVHVDDEPPPPLRGAQAPLTIPSPNML